MTNPQLSVIQNDAASAPVIASPVQHGTAQLQLSGPVQVHVHLGHGGSAPALGSAVSPATPPQQYPILLGVLALALAGGGYFAGSRSTATPPRIEEVGALAADPAPGLLPPPTPALPGVAGELPLALRQQLARPPVVSPPSGGSAPTPGAGAAPAAPARNAFGLGN